MNDRKAEAVRFPLVGQHSPDISVLTSVIRRLSICRSLQEVIETVTPAARNLLAADGVSFVLREADTCHYAEEEAIGPLWKGRRFPMSACISGWCMMEKRAAAIEDIYTDPRIPQDAYRPTFVRSLAMVPVRQDDPIAAMGAYWKEKRRIAPGDLELLQAIANAAGLAIANVDLAAEREKAARTRRELGHRIRNILTVVQALARETLRRTGGPEAFGRVFLARLKALAFAQETLVDPGQTRRTIDELIREQVLLGGNAERVEWNGPEVLLAPDEAIELTLVLHELGTNARKHGVLANDHGRITIRWHLEPEENGSIAVLSWTEQGGPAPNGPGDDGLGTSLLRTAFAKNGGAATLQFHATGIECRMRIPVR